MAKIANFFELYLLIHPVYLKFKKLIGTKYAHQIIDHAEN